MAEGTVDTAAVPNALIGALVGESMRKAGLVWLAYGSHDRALPAWHVWIDGVAYVVSGGREQALPDLASVTEVEVTVPSKDTRGRLLSWIATVRTVGPEDPDWPSATAALAANRLNALDAGDQVQRWARESVVTALSPTGAIVGDLDVPDEQSHRAAPPPTIATTLGRQPYMLRGVRRADRRPPTDDGRSAPD